MMWATIVWSMTGSRTTLDRKKSIFGCTLNTISKWLLNMNNIKAASGTHHFDANALYSNFYGQSKTPTDKIRWISLAPICVGLPKPNRFWFFFCFLCCFLIEFYFIFIFFDIISPNWRMHFRWESFDCACEYSANAVFLLESMDENSWIIFSTCKREYEPIVPWLISCGYHALFCIIAKLFVFVKTVPRSICLIYSS